MNNILTVALKEIRSAVRTPRFVLAALIVIPLVAGVAAAGCLKFNAQLEAYESTLQQETEGFRAVKDYWRMLRSFLTTFRPPNPKATLAMGTTRELGDTFFMYNINNSPNQRALLVRNNFAKLYGHWDLTRIVSLVLSFLALLFSFDAIAGEKRLGTMRMICSSPVSRTTVVAGKILGLTTALAAVILPAMLIAALVFALLVPQHAASIMPELLALTGMSILHAMVFTALGVAVSALFHSPMHALSISLAFWIALVLAIPQVGALISASMHPTPSADELGGRNDEVVARYLGRFQEVPRGETPEERIRFRKHWFEITRQYQEGLRVIWNETANRLLLQEATAMDLSWLSPASSLSLGMTGLCNTSPSAEVNTFENVWDAVVPYIDFIESRAIPDLEESFRTGQPLRTYPQGIDWDGVPKVEYRGNTTTERWMAVLHALAVHAAWFLVLLVLAIIFTRGYDPR